MEQLTLEQAADKYAPDTGVGLSSDFAKGKQKAFKAGAEWHKEQLKARMQEVINTLESEFAKQLVENVTNILFK